MILDGKNVFEIAYKIPFKELLHVTDSVLKV